MRPSVRLIGKLPPVRPWVTNAALCALGSGLACLAHQLVAVHGHSTTMGFSGVAGWSAALYIAAVLVVLTQPVNRWTFGIILVFAVACRIFPLLAEPFLSSDMYRYVWDGIVQHAHISPYRYVPGDPALAFLRAPHRNIYDHINRRDYAHTVYPPVAQMLYFVVTWISPTVRMMKLAMLGFECVAVAAITSLLRKMGKPREQVLLYAWCPLLVWEIGGAGHVDAAIIAFIALALLFRARESPALTGLCLGLAVMTKFYPLVLFPALYRRGDWKMPATLLAVVATGYAVYSRVGKLVYGFLGGYTEEEGLVTGTRYFLLQWAQSLRGLHALPTSIYLGFCALVFLALIIWAWMRAGGEAPISPRQRGMSGIEPAFLRTAAAFAFALMLLFSPHYPWYMAWLVPFFTLTPSLPLLTYLMATFFLFTTQLALPGAKMFLLNKILYCSVLCAFVLQMILRSAPLARRLNPACPDPATEDAPYNSDIPPPISVIIPALNEHESIGHVVASMPWDFIAECIVVDNGSTDGTAEVAARAGARVITSPRGFGAAMFAGAQAALPESEVLVFCDGDGSDVIDDLPKLVGPIQRGEADFVLGSRLRGQREPGSMLASQVFAGHLMSWLVQILYGFRYTDMGPFRAIRRSSFQQLGMTQMTYGWNLEMQIKAIQHGLRIVEIPVGYRCRIGGESKVSGDFATSIKAAIRIFSTLLRTRRPG